MFYFNKTEEDFADKSELETLNSYQEQIKLRNAFMGAFSKVCSKFKHEPITPQLIYSLKEETVHIFKQLALDHPLLRMPFVEFDVDIKDLGGGELNLVILNEPLDKILLACYGKAAEYIFVREALRERYYKEYELANQEYLKTRYEFTSILRSDYSVIDHSMNAARLRRSGLIPEGYEVLPVDVIDALIHAGLNAYDCAVGGKSVVKKLHDAATAAKNVLTRRKTGGAKIK